MEAYLSGGRAGAPGWMAARGHTHVRAEVLLTALIAGTAAAPLLVGVIGGPDRAAPL